MGRKYLASPLDNQTRSLIQRVRRLKRLPDDALFDGLIVLPVRGQGLSLHDSCRYYSYRSAEQIARECRCEVCMVFVSESEGFFLFNVEVES